MYDTNEIINRISVLTIAHVQKQEKLCVLALRVKSNWTFEDADELKVFYRRCSAVVSRKTKASFRSLEQFDEEEKVYPSNFRDKCS